MSLGALHDVMLSPFAASCKYVHIVERVPRELVYNADNSISCILFIITKQATWMEGAVEALMPSSASSNGSAGGSVRGGGKRGGQGSWRKIGGGWRRVGGGWGNAGRKADTGEADHGRDALKEEEGSAVSEEGMEAPLPQIDHER